MRGMDPFLTGCVPAPAVMKCFTSLTRAFYTGGGVSARGAGGPRRGCSGLVRVQVPGVHLRVELLGAVGAEPVGELRFRVRPDVFLDLVPVALVITDLLAGGADRQHALQRLDVVESRLEVLEQVLPNLFGPLAHGD